MAYNEYKHYCVLTLSYLYKVPQEIEVIGGLFPMENSPKGVKKGKKGVKTPKKGGFLVFFHRKQGLGGVRFLWRFPQETKVSF